MAVDKHAVAMMEKTAESFQKLAALQGVPCEVSVEISFDDRPFYVAETGGEKTACGESVHGLYDWLNARKH